MQLLQPSNLLSLIGSFWRKIVAKPLLSERLMASLLAAHYQTEVKATSLVKAVSNIEIPAGEITTFEKFIFSDKTKPSYTYNENTSISYSQSNSIFYGTGVNSNKTVYVIPENIISIPTLYDNPVKPTKVYTENVDYKITKGYITFKFDLPNSVIMYARKTIRDTGFTYRQLGYVIGVNLSDSVFSKVPLAELWRLFSYGPNYYNVLKILALCSNSPIINTDKEIVSGIFPVTETSTSSIIGRFVFTDRDCYFVPSDQDVVVALEQILKKGQTIGSGLAILHDKENLPNVALPENMKAGNFIRYGRGFLNPARVMVIRADVKGKETIAINYFNSVLPLDTKVIVLANKNIPIAASNSIAVTSNNPLITNSIALPSYSSTSVQTTIKASSSLKYGFYGF